MGELTKTYSRIIIDPNDHPNGIIELSLSDNQVTEDSVEPIVSVIRTAGLHGQVCNCEY